MYLFGVRIQKCYLYFLLSKNIKNNKKIKNKKPNTNRMLNCSLCALFIRNTVVVVVHLYNSYIVCLYNITDTHLKEKENRRPEDELDFR